MLFLPATTLGQDLSSHRIMLGAGSVLLIPDSITGLTLWATRATRPGYGPSPDFVGWFEPESVTAWTEGARQLIGSSGDEGGRLVARDSGFISLLRQEDACCLLAFGHPSERQRWVIEASGREMVALLDTMELLAAASRLHPPPDLGYANPTNRSATPDRTASPMPAFRGETGEVWAKIELDSSGRVSPGGTEILWASSEHLGRVVLRVLPGYRYTLKTQQSRTVVYQRFRIK